MFKRKKNKTYDDFKGDKELTTLLDLYLFNNNKNYDFRDTFLDKLKKNKHLTNEELITLMGLVSSIENKELKLKLYQTIVEELVLIITSFK